MVTVVLWGEQGAGEENADQKKDLSSSVIAQHASLSLLLKQNECMLLE